MQNEERAVSGKVIRLHDLLDKMLAVIVKIKGKESPSNDSAPEPTTVVAGVIGAVQSNLNLALNKADRVLGQLLWIEECL